MIHIKNGVLSYFNTDISQTWYKKLQSIERFNTLVYVWILCESDANYTYIALTPQSYPIVIWSR